MLEISRFQSDPEAVAALARIYEEAIPASERKPLARILADPAARITTAWLDGELAGFAIVRSGPGVDLLEYMATRTNLRGSGIGAQLYTAARSDRGRVAPLLIEVDTEREEGADREVRLRRKGFYRRLGARQVYGLDYILPMATAGTPPRMDLLVDACAEAHVPRATIEAWLRELYGDVYGQARDDPRIAMMLSPLAREVALV